MTACIRRPHAVWTTCTCPPCTLDRNRKTKLHRAGLYNRITSEAAWEIVDRRRAEGWTSLALASASGLSWRTLEAAFGDDKRGNRRTFGPGTARRIVNHGDPTAGSVGVTGSRRRLQALAHLGYDLETLATMTGIGFSTLAAIRTGATSRVGSTRYTTIRDTTARIGLTPGPSTPARQHAERKKWAPLFAWDNLDDPAEKPHRITTRNNTPSHDDLDPAVVERVLGGEKLRTTTAEKTEICRRYYALHGNTHGLAERFGWKVERYFKIRDQDTAA